MLQRQLVWLNVLSPGPLVRMWPLHFRAFPNSSVLFSFRFTVHHIRIFHHFRNVVFHIRAFPDVCVLFPIHAIVHHFRSLPSLIIGHYRILPIFVRSPSGPFHIPSFPIISVFHIRPFPEFFHFLFRHFPTKSVLCSLIPGRFRLEFPPFRDFSVSFMLRHFRKILSFMSTISVIFQAFMLFFSSVYVPPFPGIRLKVLNKDLQDLHSVWISVLQEQVMMKHLQQSALCASTLGVGTAFAFQQQPKVRTSSST